MKTKCFLFYLLFLHLAAFTCFADIIIDNKDAATSRVGNWQTSAATGYYSTGSVWASDGATFTWNFTPTQTGQQDVSMWWTQYSSRSTSIPVDIKHANGSTRVYINQQQNGGKWNSLGKFSFNSGTSYKVIITAPASPATTCADAVKIASSSGGGGGTTTTEHIYIAIAYNPDNCTGQYTSVLKNFGATQTNGVWTYTNSSIGKTFKVHFASSISVLRSALATSGAIVIVEGHSNYGLGFVFATDTEIKNQTIYGVSYIDDSRIFQMTDKWVAIDVKDFINVQAYPNWWPKFRDGSSGIMPYTFSQGTPPYNYYLSYRISGNSTYYKVESANRSALQSFPDSGKAAWFASDGSKPSTSNTAQQKYFITNSASWSNTYPKPHYKAKTIIRTKANTLSTTDLKYSRLLLDSCSSGYRYCEAFAHGVVFYSVDKVHGNNGVVFLRNYIQGKSDKQLWQALQSVEAVYDYYNFAKTPTAQLQSTSTVSALSVAQPITYTMSSSQASNIAEMNSLPVPQILDQLEDVNYTDDDLMTNAIAGSLSNKEQQAIDQSMQRIKSFDTKNNKPFSYRKSRDFYVSKKVLNFFADVSKDKLIAEYNNNNDPIIRGKIVNASGEMTDMQSIRNMLIKALDDKSTCQSADPEITGWPLRVCDAAYNQFILNDNYEDMLRAIGTGLPIEDREYHINLLKQRLSSR